MEIPKRIPNNLLRKALRELGYKSQKSKSFQEISKWINVIWKSCFVPTLPGIIAELKANRSIINDIIAEYDEKEQ